MIKAVAVIILSLVLTIKSITATGPGAKTATWHTGKTQMRHQLHCQMLLHRR
jgi:amino acid efflux transporter